MKQQIKRLQQEVQHLKRNSNINKTSDNPQLKEPNQQPAHSKLQQQHRPMQNIEIIDVISYTEQTMTTLKDFGEQLKTQLKTNLIQQDMI